LTFQRYFWIHGTLTADKENFEDDGQQQQKQQQQFCLQDDEQLQQRQEQHQLVAASASGASPSPPGKSLAPIAASPPAPLELAPRAPPAPGAPASIATEVLVAPPPMISSGVIIPVVVAASPALETALTGADAAVAAVVLLATPSSPLLDSAPSALGAPTPSSASGVLVIAPPLSWPPEASPLLLALEAAPVAAADPFGTAAATPGPMQYMDSDEEKEELELIEEKEEDNELTEDQELQHPVAVYIPNQQLAAEKNIANTVAVVHSSPNNESFPLMVSGTSFNLSSFHFATNNTSVPLFNNATNPKRPRLEYVDFSRPQLHLYMWDRRHAVSLSVQSPVTNRFQTRFFLAMTNLYMPLDANGELMYEDLVLLDLLYRLDPYAYIDAVVGVVATGEVILWQHS